ncbi:MAG: hypothetical protein Q8O56_09960 [Solirubrobacteraceae bacterium]|nr:hypothetical protein [Solirubrobacteraceae bacterium]
MSPRIRCIVIALVFVALLPAAAAQASANQASIMMDDDLLVYRDDNTASRVLTQMKTMGVDIIRVTVLWSVVAENARTTQADLNKLRGRQNNRLREAALRQNRRFRPTDPSTYPVRNWDRYDNLVRSAQNLGIRVYFNITGPGPAWAHETPPRAQRSLRASWKPRPAAFRQFVTAVGRRYSGTYRDENAGRTTLPRVSFWSLWNEPNQGGWLSPQWQRNSNGRYVPASPAIYRKLHQAGYQGLATSGHTVDSDVILMGETAPLGSNTPSEKNPMRPGLFLRELACVSSNGSSYTGASARARSCGDLSTRGGLAANGYAHHPYTKNVSPLVRDSHRDSLTMANISELGTLLDTLSARTNGAIRSGMPLFMTEFGFETNPPDRFSGVSLQLQAKYNQLGEYQAWQNPRIAAQAQFLLRDVAPVRNRRPGTKAYWFTYQSGLFFLNGTAKPAAFAYTMPFIATPHGADPATGGPLYSFWGQLRFLPDGAPDVAHIQWKPKDNSTGWVTVGDPVPVDFRGYFQAARVAPSAAPGEWRSLWVRPDGGEPSTSLSTDGS